MVKVAVIIRLSVDPLVGTFFNPFVAIVLLEVEMYFDGVRSKLRTNDRGMSFPQFFWRYYVNTLFQAPYEELQE